MQDPSSKAASPSPPSPAERARRRRWLGFFAVLGVLCVVAVVVPVVYNLQQQLRPGQLESARARWAQHGPADYDLEYTLMLGREGRVERYASWVRGGRVVLAVGDGDVLALGPGVGLVAGGTARGVVVPADVPLTIDALFAHIDSVLRADPEAGKRNLTVGVFDPRDGHPRRFIHRVRGSGEREEWIVRLLPAGAVERRP